MMCPKSHMNSSMFNESDNTKLAETFDRKMVFLHVLRYRAIMLIYFHTKMERNSLYHKNNKLYTNFVISH